MWHAMFVIQTPVLEKILRTVLVYVFIAVFSEWPADATWPASTRWT